ncbi:hypothetical protein ARMSODRAFT_450498 [Armillaria solidipes]|uniref:Uncharacterized protein n=1 Tax=Armillaria solidipes TaxID=1076256 RepID=A0A2H3BCM0_9AGAR|nr:hypothetical protein ARMSODRAFT_450498 [Armillaria solidipes]
MSDPARQLQLSRWKVLMRDYTRPQHEQGRFPLVLSFDRRRIPSKRHIGMVRTWIARSLVCFSPGSGSILSYFIQFECHGSQKGRSYSENGPLSQVTLGVFDKVSRSRKSKWPI